MYVCMYVCMYFSPEVESAGVGSIGRSFYGGSAGLMVSEVIDVDFRVMGLLVLLLCFFIARGHRFISSVWSHGRESELLGHWW